MNKLGTNHEMRFQTRAIPTVDPTSERDQTLGGCAYRAYHRCPIHEDECLLGQVIQSPRDAPSGALANCIRTRAVERYNLYLWIAKPEHCAIME
ncbi:MAG: hypothetical protein ACK2UM_02475 [Anaerolineales bacterium]|jgi:hypothetical protein